MQRQILEKSSVALENRRAELIQQIDDLEKSLQDESLHKKLLTEERQAIERKCESLRSEQQYLEKENQRLEERYYPLLHQEETHKRIHALEREKAALQEKISQLQAEIEQDQFSLQQQLDYEVNLRRISIVSVCQRMNGATTDLFHAQIDTQFDSVIHAVEFAEYLFGDVLEIWDSARQSAYQSNFIRPRDVYLNLQSLAWLGRDYFTRDGELGQPIYEYLQQLNCTYSSRESDTVKNDPKLLSDRKFRHPGKPDKIMLEHLKVGTGRGTDKNLRIYFALNRETKKVEIGHCGNHLRLRST